MNIFFEILTTKLEFYLSVYQVWYGKELDNISTNMVLVKEYYVVNYQP